MKPAYETFDTPLGAFTVCVDAAGRLTAAAFGGIDSLPLRPQQRESLVLDARATAAARRQLEEYFAGRRRVFDIEMAPLGSEFQQGYWRRLARVPFGGTTTYGALAAELGSSPRAIGRANATNPICLILPCHRVIGSDGSLTGYAYGLEVKRRLIEHERDVLDRAD